MWKVGERREGVMKIRGDLGRGLRRDWLLKPRDKRSLQRRESPWLCMPERGQCGRELRGRVRLGS